MTMWWGCVVAFLDHWQSLLAGLLGFAAAIWAVVLALRGEKRKAARELIAMQRSVAVEVRQYAANMFRAHQTCRELAKIVATPVTSRMIENAVRLPPPVIYPGIADRIGLFGDQAHDIVLFYAQIAVIRAGVERLLRHRTPDSVPSSDTAAMADSLIEACKTAVRIVPHITTGVGMDDQVDAKMIAEIDRTGEEWDEIKEKLLTS